MAWSKGFIKAKIEKKKTLFIATIIYKYFLCSSANVYENLIHTELDEYKIRGEWYKLKKQQIINIIEKYEETYNKNPIIEINETIETFLKSFLLDINDTKIIWKEFQKYIRDNTNTKIKKIMPWKKELKKILKKDKYKSYLLKG